MKTSSRHLGLWGLLGLQAFCVFLLIGEITAEAIVGEESLGVADSELVEAVVIVALVLGLIFTALEIRRLLGRQRRIEDQLRAASGAFVELLEEHFEGWELTPSERDVALMAIKGMTIADIARLRATKEGTIKAQCNAIYRKAGVSGRPQLLSIFIEELIAQGLVEPG